MNNETDKYDSEQFKYERDVIFKVRRVANLMKRRSEEILHQTHSFNFTSRHLAIAKYLSENRDKDIFQKDIEEAFCIRRSTVTAILNLMEKNGIIKRESVAYDARLKKIILTKKAMDIRSKVIDRMVNMQDEMLCGIREQELENFCKVLDKIQDNIKN